MYGFEVITPTEIAVASHWVKHFEAIPNDIQRRWASDEIQGNMWLATARYYNRGVSSCQIYVGKIVWRRNEFLHLDKMSKLSLKWEGPYKDVVIPHPNTYVLEDEEGNKLKNNFNDEHLKKFFV